MKVSRNRSSGAETTVQSGRKRRTEKQAANKFFGCENAPADDSLDVVDGTASDAEIRCVLKWLVGDAGAVDHPATRGDGVEALVREICLYLTRSQGSQFDRKPRDRRLSKYEKCPCCDRFGHPADPVEGK